MLECAPKITPVPLIAPDKVKNCHLLFLWQALHLIVRITVFTSKEKKPDIIGPRPPQQLWVSFRPHMTMSSSWEVAIVSSQNMSPKLKPLQEDVCWPHTLSHAGQHYLRLPKNLENTTCAMSLAQARNCSLSTDYRNHADFTGSAATYSAWELVCIFAFLLKPLFAGQVCSLSETTNRGLLKIFL